MVSKQHIFDKSRSILKGPPLSRFVNYQKKITIFFQKIFAVRIVNNMHMGGFLEKVLTTNQDYKLILSQTLIDGKVSIDYYTKMEVGLPT